MGDAEGQEPDFFLLNHEAVGDDGECLPPVVHAIKTQAFYFHPIIRWINRLLFLQFRVFIICYCEVTDNGGYRDRDYYQEEQSFIENDPVEMGFHFVIVTREFLLQLCYQMVSFLSTSCCGFSHL